MQNKANKSKEDLRVTKTKAAIRQAFKEMICDMPYQKITIKELSQRAMINRKTFYRHYDSLDDLLSELQNEIVDEFIRQDISYQSQSDIRKIIRFFFEYAAAMPPFYERLLCSGNDIAIGAHINEKIMTYRKTQNKGAFSDNEWVDNLAFAYFSVNSLVLYRQWVADGKRLPLEDLIQTATHLICQGLDHYVKSA